MKAFVNLFEKLDHTFSTKEKVDAIKQYFDQSDARESIWALFFLSGGRIKRFITSKMLSEWCMEALNIPDWLFSESYSATGDAAETIALLYGHNLEASKEEISLADWMEKKILPLRKLGKEQQKQQVIQWWSEIFQKECFLINKILTGGFRVGVSELLVLRGLSASKGVPRTVLAHHLSGEWSPTPEFFEELCSLNPSKDAPYPFFLASPIAGDLADLGPAEDWLAEWKWDGIRGQLIFRDGKITLWSRGMEIVTKQFPELTNMTFPHSVVLDGEILAYKEGQPLSFGDLQIRLGRKKVSQEIMNQVPVTFMAYDILEKDGKDLRDLPFIERRRILDMLNILTSPLLPFSSWDDIIKLRESAREGRTEGLMLKRKNSKYGVGRRRGDWWKYKVDPLTIDAVLIYAQPGSGWRANLYTDYTFGVWKQNELVPIVKAYSGLSQEEINRLDKWIRKNTLEKFGPVRKVKPEWVFEIAFEGIQISNRHKSGVALRFPRILRWREDKLSQEADQLEEIKKTFLK
jgi:DNA ligase 1